MASRAQSITVCYVAWDTVNNIGKTGDVANHTLRWIKDGTSSAPTNSASEVDATNTPGVYKITLTTAECTCDYGTLAGKSSTANISIMPTHVAFEQLPTAVPGANGGLPTVDASARVKANLEAIDGLATSGNNATLNLKSLNITNSTGTAITAKSTGSNGVGIDVAGHGSADGIKIVGGNNASGNGGNAVYALGGTSATNFTGGIGIKCKGGTPTVSGSGGSGLRAEGGGGTYEGAGAYLTSANGTGLIIYSSSGDGAIIQGRAAVSINGSLVGANIYSPDGVAVQINSPDGYALYVEGDKYGIGITRPKKNVELQNFMFPMFNSTTKVPMGGLSVTAQRAIDGNAFSPCSNGVSEISNGTYRISLSADDMNGDKIMFRFTATGADDQLIEILTQD